MSYNLSFMFVICIITLVSADRYQSNKQPTTKTYSYSDCNELEIRAKNMGMKNLRGRYYYFSREGTNWNQARRACEKKGLNYDLISIESQEENTAIVEFISSNKLEKQTFWTGGTDTQLENSWVWIHSKANFTYTNWDNEEPNSNFGDEDCVAIYTLGKNKTGYWNDAYCGRDFNYICELHWPKECRDQSQHSSKKNTSSSAPSFSGMTSSGTTISLITLYSFVLFCSAKFL